jgi:Flp pilus assembly protein TadB
VVPVTAALAGLAAGVAILLATPPSRPARRRPSTPGPTTDRWAVVRRASEWCRRCGRTRRRDAQLPEALERTASALRAGVSLVGALEAAAAASPAPLGDELAQLMASVDNGRSLAAALDEWSERATTPPVRLAATALALGAEAGGAVARAVDGVAATLRDRRTVAAEASALATQARASAALIAAAPLAFSALVSAADPGAAAMLFTTPVGLLCLAGGLALNTAGVLWMARIVRTAR